MTAADFEKLNELEAELWIAKRFRHFAAVGFSPALALALAVHPDIAAPLTEPAAAA